MMPSLESLRAENDRLASHLWQWEQGSIGFRICPKPDSRLTPMQTRLESELINGTPTKEICIRHGLSYGSVVDHRYALRKKLGDAVPKHRPTGRRKSTTPLKMERAVLELHAQDMKMVDIAKKLNISVGWACDLKKSGLARASLNP